MLQLFISDKQKHVVFTYSLEELQEGRIPKLVVKSELNYWYEVNMIGHTRKKMKQCDTNIVSSFVQKKVLGLAVFVVKLKKEKMDAGD